MTTLLKKRRYWFALVGFCMFFLPIIAIWMAETDFSTGNPKGLPDITTFILLVPPSLLASALGFPLRSDLMDKIAMISTLFAWGFLGALIGIVCSWLFPGKKGESAK